MNLTAHCPLQPPESMSVLAVKWWEVESFESMLSVKVRKTASKKAQVSLPQMILTWYVMYLPSML